MRIVFCSLLLSCAACGTVEGGNHNAIDGAVGGSDIDAALPASDAAPPAPDAAPLGGCDVAPVIAGTGAVTSWSRLTSAVNVDYFGNGVHAVDPTQFANVWHYWSTSPDPVPWPGGYGIIASIPLPVDRYVSAELTVPDPYFSSPNVPAQFYGDYKIGQSEVSAPVTMTISTHCGDFGQLSPTTIVPGCVANMAPTNGLLQWRASGNCVLQDGQRYYFNIVNADISALPTGGPATTTQNSRCANGICYDPIQDGPGSWQGYVP